MIGEEIDASLGIVTLPGDARELGEALRIADQRMYVTKRTRAGRGSRR